MATNIQLKLEKLEFLFQADSFFFVAISHKN